jgi:branched-subunit amino acid ABC-type transport system permease component
MWRGIGSAVIAAIIVSTLATGGVYALLASGLSLIFGVAHIVNLAHTAFYMVAAYFLWFFAQQLGLNPVASVAITISGVTLLGLLSYQFLLNRVRQHPQALLLITIALAMVFQEILVLLFGSHFHTSPALIDGSTQILGITVTYQRLLLLGAVVVIMVGLWLFLSKTKLGTAIRATANDAEIANLMGDKCSQNTIGNHGNRHGLGSSGRRLDRISVGIPSFRMGESIDDGPGNCSIGGPGKSQGEYHRGFHYRPGRDTGGFSIA